MKLSVASLNQAFLRDKQSNCSTPRWTCLLLLGMLGVSPTLWAQQSEAPTASDSQTIQLLLQRVAELEAKVRKIDQLEARIKQLEGEKPAPAATARVSSPAPAQTNTPSEMETSQQEMPAVAERMDLSKTLLRIRGFGDITLHGDDQKGDRTSFSLGQLDLFVTSDISEKFKFLSEIVFEGGPDNIYGVTRGQNNVFAVDVERYLIEYSHNDYFKLAAGRWHTAIGYYNTAYHHSTWFQTATDRPFLFNFEDRGGILPIHSVGLSASGLIPSGRLGLHYVAEVGNGRASRSPLTDEPVQNVIDEQSHKAYNLALFARPEAIRGLQVGFSVYRDLLDPLNSPRISESILAAHAVFTRPSFEWLNEALVVRHSPLGLSRTFNTPGFYSQVSKQFGSWRPYLRYQYVNGSDTEPVFPDVGLRHGPSAGLRYDASESVAVKLQYDYTALRRQNAVNALALQIGFTF
ncbi:MAG: hypothetical protein DMG39_13020 [Acidobacteria bacterium]|nr:MAG: hypothetical protein DMG39_13020 [Acidobacteriota bacterium]